MQEACVLLVVRPEKFKNVLLENSAATGFQFHDVDAIGESNTVVVVRLPSR